LVSLRLRIRTNAITRVILVSALRIPSIVAIPYSRDPSWDSASIAIWSAVELNTAIVCACSITLKPFLTRVFPQLFSREDHYQMGRENNLRNQNGTHPPTIGTRRERRLPRNLTLETFDDMAVMCDKPSMGSPGTDTSSTLSPLPLDPQKEEHIV
jgi:hypothetical protein